MGQLSVLKVIDWKHREKCAEPSQLPEKVIDTDPKVDMVDVVPVAPETHTRKRTYEEMNSSMNNKQCKYSQKNLLKQFFNLWFVKLRKLLNWYLCFACIAKIAYKTSLMDTNITIHSDKS